MNSNSEIIQQANFSYLRYAQCWEDADILVKGLDINEQDICLSVASGGENTLALLANNPKKVIALDLNSTQLACLELKVCAFKNLKHMEVLELLGSIDSNKRIYLYDKIKNQLSENSLRYWETKKNLMSAQGISGIGKFESYFRIFKEKILPLVHNRNNVNELFRNKDKKSRIKFFETEWNSWRWRLLIKLFFSKKIMGKLGRDPAFFKYADGNLSNQIAQRVKYAMTDLNPTDNPYLYWILNNKHDNSLPYALRPENFERIRHNLDKLEWHLLSLEDYINIWKHEGKFITKYNLSNIFEYMSYDNYLKLLKNLITIGKPKGRLLYWNMMVPRFHPEELKDKYTPLIDLEKKLFLEDKAFFYNKLVIEEIK